ncbi:hypothetical protein ABTE85_20785, partial [Acinetobacter baumannii]
MAEKLSLEKNMEQVELQPKMAAAAARKHHDASELLRVQQQRTNDEVKAMELQEEKLQAERRRAEAVQQVLKATQET